MNLARKERAERLKLSEDMKKMLDTLIGTSVESDVKREAIEFTQYLLNFERINQIKYKMSL